MSWGMYRLNEKQRQVVAEKLADFGNIAAGSLIFGAAVSQKLLATPSILVGFAVVITCYVIAARIVKDN